MAAKARIVGQFRLADQGEEVAPVLVVVDQQAQVAVGRGVGPAVRREQPGVAGGAQRRVERGAAQVVAQRHVRHALEHGNLDLLPASAGAGMQHGRHQRDGGMQADGAIRQRQARSAAPRRSAAHTAPRCRPVPGSGRRRRAARRRVPARRSHRRPGRRCADCAPPPLHRTGPAWPWPGADVVEQGVAALGQPKAGLSALGRLQVQRDRALVAVQVQVQMAHAGIAHGADRAQVVAGGDST